MLRLLRHMPPYNGALRLTKEQEENLFVIYRYDEQTDRYVFFDLYDDAAYQKALSCGQAKEYEGDCVGVPVSSTGYKKRERHFRRERRLKM